MSVSLNNVGSTLSTVDSENDAHRASTNNPHGVTASQVGAYTTAQVDSLISQAISSMVSVAVRTGTISNGGTIPLPSGYTQSQCKWIVGVGQISSSHGDHNSNHNVTFTANSNRVVTTSGIGTGSGVANYLIIGIK